MITLCANKIDLEEERKITTEQGTEFAEIHGLVYKEVSAKEHKGVEDLFNSIVERMPSTEIYKAQLSKQKEKKTRSLNTKPADEDSYYDSCSGSC